MAEDSEPTWKIYYEYYVQSYFKGRLSCLMTKNGNK